MSVEIERSAEAKRHAVADTARKYLGSPSIKFSDEAHGMTPDGFDCSGFVRFVLSEAGVYVPRIVRRTREFFDHFGNHGPYRSAGDLVFFSKTGEWITHMGILLDSETYIHAPGKDGTVVEIRKLLTEVIPPKEGASFYQNPVGFKRVEA